MISQNISRFLMRPGGAAVPDFPKGPSGWPS